MVFDCPVCFNEDLPLNDHTFNCEKCIQNTCGDCFEKIKTNCPMCRHPTGIQIEDDIYTGELYSDESSDSDYQEQSSNDHPWNDYEEW